jgi:RNA polymerase sigma-70 factor (ECF subfamily)
MSAQHSPRSALPLPPAKRTTPSARIGTVRLAGFALSIGALPLDTAMALTRGTSAHVGEEGKPADAAMARYARGEDAAFAVVYDAVAPRLYGYLLRQTHDPARAEDIVQQTMLQMHRARGRFIPGAEVTPWAFAIARRLLIDSARRRKREVLVPTDEEGEGDVARSNEPAADALVAADELARRIQRELVRLPEAQRVAFELVKQEGLSLAEAAQVLGTTVAAVKLRAHRAYEALRAVLGDVLGTGTEGGAE